MLSRIEISTAGTENSLFLAVSILLRNGEIVCKSAARFLFLASSRDRFQRADVGPVIQPELAQATPGGPSFRVVEAADACLEALRGLTL